MKKGGRVRRPAHLLMGEALLLVKRSSPSSRSALAPRAGPRRRGRFAGPAAALGNGSHPPVRAGKSRGFAFLAYMDQRSTVLAVDNLSGARVAGRVVRVEHVDNYRKKKAEVGGGGGWFFIVCGKGLIRFAMLKARHMPCDPCSFCR